MNKIDGMTNLERSGRIADLVLVYGQYSGYAEREDETVAVDMLTDMRHWADVYGVDLDDAWEASGMHYSAEVTRTDDTCIRVECDRCPRPEIVVTLADWLSVTSGDFGMPEDGTVMLRCTAWPAAWHALAP